MFIDGVCALNGSGFMYFENFRSTRFIIGENQAKNTIFFNNTFIGFWFIFPPTHMRQKSKKQCSFSLSTEFPCD